MNTTTDFAATIGLDWADQKHDLWIRPAGGSKAEHLGLEQTPEVLHEWVAKARERFANRRIAIAVETSRGPVISVLMAYDFIVLFPVNPKCLKDYRGAFSVSGAKDDRTDAQLLEEFVRLHRDKLRALEPDTELTRKLAGLVENRRRLVDERTRLVNQMHATLKTYYPVAETLRDGQMNTAMAADFLARWPDLEFLQKVKPEVVRSFFYKHNSRGAKKTEERLAAIQKAKALTTDAAIIVPARHLILAWAGMLRPLHQAVARLDKEIQQAMDQHPDAATIHVRYRCPKFGRQTFHENAGCALKKEPWARCYYEQQKERNKGKHHQACRALAYKLLRIYFACWKHRKAYEPNRYLKALEDHASPLHRKLQNLTAALCE